MAAHPNPAQEERLTRAPHALLVLAVVACRLIALRSCATYDDAFITYRYAQNLAHGLGLVYNPGAAWEPVLGTTTPLYALILAGFARVGADLVLASLVLNILFDALSATLLPRLLGCSRASSTFALIAFAALPQLVRISLGGMETPLFILCGLCAAVALAEGRPIRAGVLAALACMVRPEGIALCAVLFVARIREPRTLVRFAVPIIVLGALGIGILVHFYGSPIPQSVLAKSSMHALDARAETIERWKTVLAQSFAPAWALVPLLPVVLFGASRALARAGALRLFSLWSLGITLAYLAARPHTWGWYYGVPLVGWTLWFGVGAARAFSWVGWRAPPPRLVVPGAVAAVGIVCWLRPTPVNARVYAPMRAFAEETSMREPKARILASDIGAIGWFWKGTVLDSEGLVWPEALRLKQPDAIIEAERPEYVLLVAERARLLQFQERPDLFQRYVAIARFSAAGLTELQPTPDELAPEWSQDYLVYRRREP